MKRMCWASGRRKGKSDGERRETDRVLWAAAFWGLRDPLPACPLGECPRSTGAGTLPFALARAIRVSSRCWVSACF